MRRILAVSALFTSVLGFSPESQAQIAQPWMKDWTIAGSECPNCSRQDSMYLDAFKGMNVKLDAKLFINPLFESCGEPNTPDYSQMTQRSAQATLRALQQQYPWAKNIRFSGNPVAGNVRCGPGLKNVGAFIFDGTKGYYLHEGGGIVSLQ